MDTSRKMYEIEKKNKKLHQLPSEKKKKKANGFAFIRPTHKLPTHY